MRRTTAKVLSGLMAALWVSGCAYQHQLLVNPKVTIPGDVSNTKVQESVHKALSEFGWTIDREDPGTTTAHLQKDKLYASVRVDYDQKQATVRHVETRGMNYEKSPTGQETIHSHYLTWANNIATRLQQKLNTLSATH